MNSEAFSGGRRRHPAGRLTGAWTDRRFRISGRDFAFAQGSPGCQLAPLISSFWELQGDLGDACDRILPTADTALVLNLGAPQGVEDGGKRQGWSNAWIAGPRLTPLTTISPDGTWICGARLTHRGAYALRVAPRHLLGALVDLRDVRSADADLVERARACSTPGDRFELLAQTICNWAKGSAAWNDTAAHAIGAIGRSHGIVRIDHLASDIGWSRQRLHRALLDSLGMSPKAAARLFRFRHAVDLIGEADVVRLPEIAAESGYFDQAHFTRDFTQFSGMTPGAFIRFRTPGSRGFSASS